MSGSKKLVDLTPDEVTSLCEYVTSLSDPRTVDCGNGTTITVEGQTVEECVSSFTMDQTNAPNCMVTVAQAEACSEDLSAFTDEQLCSDTTTIPASCAPLFSADCNPQ